MLRLQYAENQVCVSDNQTVWSFLAIGPVCVCGGEKAKFELFSQALSLSFLSSHDYFYHFTREQRSATPPTASRRDRLEFGFVQLSALRLQRPQVVRESSEQQRDAAKRRL